MSFLLSETMDGQIVEAIVSSKLTKESYQAFVPMIQSAIRKQGEIGVLFVTVGFKGWDAGANWDDVSFEQQVFSKIRRLAIVGESKWETGKSTFCRPFTTADIRYFEHADVEKARQWIKEVC